MGPEMMFSEHMAVQPVMNLRVMQSKVEELLNEWRRSAISAALESVRSQQTLSSTPRCPPVILSPCSPWSLRDRKWFDTTTKASQCRMTGRCPLISCNWTIKPHVSEARVCLQMLLMQKCGCGCRGFSGLVKNIHSLCDVRQPVTKCGCTNSALPHPKAAK